MALLFKISKKVLPSFEVIPLLKSLAEKMDSKNTSDVRCYTINNNPHTMGWVKSEGGKGQSIKYHS